MAVIINFKTNSLAVVRNPTLQKKERCCSFAEMKLGMTFTATVGQKHLSGYMVCAINGT